MADVQKNIPRSLIRLVTRFNEEKDVAIKESGNILLQFVKDSVRRRAYKTGFLFSSIEQRPKKFKTFETIEVFTNVFYAGYLERGTRFIKARRMFALGLIEAKASINNRFVSAFERFVSSL